MNGCMLPGRMISVAGAACLGATTETEGTANWSVTVRRVVWSLTRDRIPKIKTNTAASTASAGISQRRNDFRGVVGRRASFSLSTCSSSSVCVM